MLLEVKHLTKRFGGLTAVADMSFSLAQGDIVGVFGPNGSGKTTLLNLISGVYLPSAGDLVWQGARINGSKPHEIAEAGIVKTFQNPQLFGELSVFDNVAIAGHLALKRAAGWRRLATLLPRRRGGDELAPQIERILRLCRLHELRDVAAASLSYGGEKMLGVAMALMCDPKLLLLDEPGSGLGHDEIANLDQVLRDLREHGTTLCVIDHRVGFLGKLADRAIVIHHGAKIAEGTPEQVLREPAVIEAYLGAAMLELADLDVHYAKNHVLKGVTLRVGAGEVVALVGANAAGKTTTLRTVMGLKAATRGTVTFQGTRLDAVPTHERVGRGLVLVPEGRQVFPRFTVVENLLMGGYQRPDRNRLERDFDAMFAMFPRLAERKTQRAGSMSGGEQQMLAIARGLIAQPKCLLLDEPTLGLAPIIVEEISRTIRTLAARGMTILIAEQNAAMALAIADRAYVLETGRVALEGSGAELAGDAAVQRNYLGG